MKEPIKTQRIAKEKESLKKLNPEIYSYKFINEDIELIVDIKDKNLGLFTLSIFLTQNYPFEIPYVKLEFMNKDIYINLDYENYNDFNIYYRSKWTCKLTLDQIIQEMHNFVINNHQLVEALPHNAVFSSMKILGDNFNKNFIIILILLIAIMIRVLMGFGSYSGINDPPQYGDYEAQRHWMELTYNTPMLEWYIATPYNNLTYWRIDYPPMTAYHSWMMGVISSKYEPDSMTLLDSHGYETQSHKFYMRMTVLVNDLIFFFIGSLFVAYLDLKKYNFYIKWISLLLILLAPPNILIDHGHFQYNCVMLGLTLLGFYFCNKDHLVIGSILFTTALNFKQMAFYYAFAFFAFILGRIIVRSKKSSHRFFSIIFGVLYIGFVVIMTSFIIWLPWARSTETFFQVVQSIFPFHRGLYETKVSTFWCVSSIFIKWKKLFSMQLLTIMSSLLCIILSLPSMIATIVLPNIKTFKLCLFNVSMAFFFFAFHVHEKTILVPLLGLGLSIRYFGHYYLDFVIFACMSMSYLLHFDIMDFQYFVSTLFFWYFGYKMIKLLESLKFIKDLTLKKYNGNSSIYFRMKLNEQTIVNYCLKLIRFIDKIYFKLIRILFYAIVIIMHVVEKLVKPPAHQPVLWYWFIDIVAFFVFAIIWIRCNVYLFYLVAKNNLKEERVIKKVD